MGCSDVGEIQKSFFFQYKFPEISQDFENGTEMIHAYLARSSTLDKLNTRFDQYHETTLIPIICLKPTVCIIFSYPRLACFFEIATY